MPSGLLTRPRPRGGGAVERTGAFHPEIQALRALAVSLVVIYHLQPSVLRNGFVGVDVFLVISGFLITGHVTRGLLSGRRFSLSGFYVRRIRRLLPAALTVLAAVAVGTFLFVPQTQWVETARQIASSAFYVENWALAANATDYSAPGTDTSPLQHFWSLSVEEQFYLVWPALLLAAAYFGRRRPRVALAATVGAAFVASFVFSIVFTGYDAAAAYFVTPARIWEFAAGGLLALLPAHRAIPERLRPFVSWGGLVVILAAALELSDAAAFPGWIAAIPVLGTLAVIAAGDATGRYSTRRLFALRPVQYLGDISYSVYLWHWPLIVIAPVAIGSKLTLGVKVAVVIVSLILAVTTKRFIEDPFREDRLRSAQHGQGGRRFGTLRVLGLALAGMLVVAATAVPLAQIATASESAALQRLASVVASPPADFGAASAESGIRIVSDGPVAPDPVIARDDFVEKQRGVVCQQSGAYTGVTTCTFGSRSPSALRVALAGDSHASQWLPALIELADSHGWQLTTYLRSGCPLSTLGAAGETSGAPACAPWRTAALQQLVKSKYDVVFVSSFAQTNYAGGTAPSGLAAAWKQLTAAGSKVIAIRDDPTPQAAGLVDVPSCVARHRDDLQDCALPRQGALLDDPQVAAAAGVPGAAIVDLTKFFCTSTTCPAVIGGVLVYRDGHHLTATYVRTLTPYLRAALRSADASLGL